MEAPTPEPVFEPRTLTIRAAGDIMAHDKQLRVARMEDGSYDFYPQLSMIAQSLASADYTIANLETTIGKYRDMDYSGFPRFNAPESLLDAVDCAGVDFLTLANNHMLDRYYDGLVATIGHVEETGFDFGGGNRTEQERDTPRTVEINGVKLGFLCYTQSTNGMENHADPDAMRFCVNYLKEADFEEDVRALREAGAEVVIAIPHWGEEYTRSPNSYQKRKAQEMVAAGVDVILGSHPHVVQPVQQITDTDAAGRERDVLIAYSLGNCVSNQVKRYTYAGIILEFTLVERQQGGFSIEDVGYVPTYCWRTSSNVQTLPILLYSENPPENMDQNSRSQMRTSLRDLRQVLGEDLILLEE